MYVRLGLATPKEGMTEEALHYFRDEAIPVYDQVSGLLGAAACIKKLGTIANANILAIPDPIFISLLLNIFSFQFLSISPCK